MGGESERLGVKCGRTSASNGSNDSKNSNDGSCISSHSNSFVGGGGGVPSIA